MAEYKKILSGYVNENRDGNGKYLTITNMSDEEIVLKPGEKLFLNATPEEVLEKNPRVPQYSKTIKVESTQTSESSAPASADLDTPEGEDIPF